MKKIKKLDLINPTNYIAYLEGASLLPDAIDPSTKQALTMIQDKINEIIDSLQERKTGN